MVDAILNNVGKISLPGFFVTVEFTKESDTYPTGLEAFIFEKLDRIHQGVKVRKFSYQEGGWRMILTFFPTDRVVDKRYAVSLQSRNKMK